MPYELLQTQTPTEMVQLLNGIIFAPKAVASRRVDGGPMVPATEEVIDGLNGLTLVFTTPAVTVTFATVNPVKVSDMLDEIDTQLKVADALAEVGLVNNHTAPGSLNPPGKRLTLVTSTPAGLALNLTTSTAAALLGFKTAGTLTRALIVSTRIVGGGDTISGGHYVILAP